ncbi:MAG: hypothetical protein AAGA85_01170 [Bacteroidota bacterium]
MKNIFYFILAGALIACDGFELDDNDIGNLEALPEYVAFDAPGQDASNDDEEVSEGDDLTLIVEAPIGTLEDIVVNYTFGGDAVFGEDFTVAGADASGGSVTVTHNLDATGGNATGGVSVTDRGFIDIDFLIDGLDDGEKTLSVTLESATRNGEAIAVGRGGTDFLASQNIIISDVALTAGFTTDSLTVVENVTDTLSLGVEINFAVDVDLTFEITDAGTLPGGAVTFISGSLPSTLTIPAGETSASVTFTPVNDIAAGTKSTTYTISTIGSGSLDVSNGTPEADLVILDEDKSLTFAAGDVAASIQSFDLTLANTSSVDVSINYTIAGTGGAAAGVDFDDVSQTVGTLTIPAGQTTAQVALRINTGATGGATVTLDTGSLTATDAEVELSGDTAVSVTF